ncbi:hypothetical protein BCR33DRAFT_850288 [Rhizoclosmatium globosum]|uniref:DDE Tnp4 domain-containing protein n=1 Tax=Rhizoclosmatium globosum TaxID=329046 RepID=A0A1Y2CCK5_9FUNG|nr:hypothetical protein BCR33DRAFT_850288 [Rhizoclosmatium globosum]|eukprot:ORY44780.1 hypothetical protein BCR33DRAFT_850288 [Rhizoclosmatium globosum]
MSNTVVEEQSSKPAIEVMQSIKSNTTKQAAAEYLGLKSYGYAAAKVKARVMYLGQMFKGAVHDMAMYVKDHPTIAPGERVLADKGYVGLHGRQLGLIVPFKQQANQPALTPFQDTYNKMHAVKWAKTFLAWIEQPAHSHIAEVQNSINFGLTFALLQRGHKQTSYFTSEAHSHYRKWDINAMHRLLPVQSEMIGDTKMLTPMEHAVYATRRKKLMTIFGAV